MSHNFSDDLQNSNKFNTKVYKFNIKALVSFRKVWLIMKITIGSIQRKALNRSYHISLDESFFMIMSYAL